jgi:hypothetical protein
VLIRRDDVLEAEVDGERVVMSGRSYTYFGLVGTGLAVWQRIDGTANVDDIVAALAEEYDADRSQIDADVVEFVSALEAAQLIET